MLDLAKTKGCDCSEEIPLEECVRCICELGSKLIADMSEVREDQGANERGMLKVLHTDMRRDMGATQALQMGVKGGDDMPCKGKGGKNGGKKKG